MLNDIAHGSGLQLPINQLQKKIKKQKTVLQNMLLPNNL
ncbi:hypothetical protein CCAND95_130081 [Capnocytophaga canis]|uniref:Uncharacterized protein n=1 Tax=Capnocytophaga canis TaxID=1848903 RepID=A0A0B7I515_9FLAO|nr:hypothetical protein CCAND95_130081 [Capnocytophaga canis]CEN46700.1 hypothetical protein CCAND38_370061 [Capnocytophaga canis]